MRLHPVFFVSFLADGRNRADIGGSINDDLTSLFPSPLFSRKKNCNQKLSSAIALASRKLIPPEAGDDEQQTKETLSSFFANFWNVESNDLLIGDLMTILLTTQLLGLADAIQVEGLEGFLLPITMPTTLGTLVQRDTAISLAWVFSALKNGSYLVESISDDETLRKNVLDTFVDYSILRVGCALLFSFVMGQQPFDGLELLREGWFTLIMLGAFRYIYAKNALIY